jgi:tRNA U34 5-methylaminomethyl-2-thiouridine-forming methyltransferase MnmC
MIIPPYLVNEHFNDRYFDVVDALDEAQQVFFRHNDLIERITAAAGSGHPLVIGETGFGVGRNVISLMEFLAKSGLRDVAITYCSVELYPISAERMLAILDGFKDRVGTEIDALAEAYREVDLTVPGWHGMKIQQPFGTIDIMLWIGEALEMVQALEKPCDIWFLDGHGPKKNPDMWRPELLMAIGKKTRAGGGCATFTVAGEVRRGLADAGFLVKKLPGCGGKKEVLQGIRT